MTVCHAQPKYWELQQGELEKIVRESDLVAIGKLTAENTPQIQIRIMEVL